MGRTTTGPRYFASKGGYFVTMNGQRICLAKGPEKDHSVREEANRRYHELMLARPTQGDGAAVVAILDAYLHHLKQHAKPSTFSLWSRIYQAFVKHLGTITVRELKQHMVSEWLSSMSEPRIHPLNGRVIKWNDGTRRIAITALKAAFNWAIGEGLITTNPVAKMKAPPPRSRGGEELISQEQFQVVMASSKPKLSDLLTALWETGARPNEVFRVEAAHYRKDIGAWVFEDHKTARKTGKRRVVYLTERMVEMSENLAMERPTGPLFRNTRGRPWRLGTVAAQFQRFRKLGLIGKATVYSLRHRFATDFLLAGGSLAYLAQLQGNTVAMIEKHYGHLAEHGQASSSSPGGHSPSSSRCFSSARLTSAVIVRSFRSASCSTDSHSRAGIFSPTDRNRTPFFFATTASQFFVGRTSKHADNLAHYATKVNESMIIYTNRYQ